MNTVKTFILLAGLTALFLIIGYAIGGYTGLVISFGLAILMNFSAYWFSDTMVLKMYDAKPLAENNPIYGIVKQLANQANLPIPKVYLIDTPTPNAFATGRNPEHASLAVTQGLLNHLNTEELTGVLAHELAHVQHHDTLISVIAATLAGAISSLANIFMWSSFGGRSENEQGSSMAPLVMSVLAPVAAGLIQMAVSRSREFDADEGGARICKNPQALAQALAKIELASQQGQFQQAQAHPTTAHLFIINPLTTEKWSALFSTHPPTKERIQRLQAMRL